MTRRMRNRPDALSLCALLATVHVLSSCQAFHVPRPAKVPRPYFTVRSSTQLHSSEKEREIAELEERLAALKAGQDTADAPTATSVQEYGADYVDEDGELPPSTMAPDDGFDMNAYRKRVANIKEPPPGEFLSEAWKESVEEQPGLGETTKTLGIGLGVILALVAFSQIPIGDDGLAKYSEKIGL